MAGDQLDMENRDPNDLNAHMKACFEEVLGEPDGVRSIGCVWKLSYTCFNLWKRLCYIIPTFLCGMCMAGAWGCKFAATALCHVWCITPGLSNCAIQLIPLRKCYLMCIDCCVGPICETLGLCLSKIKISKN